MGGLKIAPLLILILILEGCVSMTIGTKEKIFINTDPEGAEVIEGNRILGITPGYFKVKRNIPYLILRKEGFLPETLRINARNDTKRWIYSGIMGAVSGLFLGSIFGFFGPPPEVESNEEEGAILAEMFAPLAGAIIWGTTGLVVGPVISILIDHRYGALKKIEPRSFEVKLRKRGEG
jgi:hypothetical protein